ncbi:GNAT family N-acetyltransferase [Microbacterium terregens]|uniref:GNAT family N-acetyltransferase n=1 Tax=Microbacterium terregens TaxID=69363 RepID=A0ABV5T136_9MICO
MNTISALTAADHDEWLALWRGYLEFYETELPAAQTELTFARLIDGTELHGALARDGAGTAIGLVHWLTHPATWSAGSYCYLEDLFVSADARGGGAGASLIQHVRTWAQEAGCAKVYWLTSTDNRRARELYDRVARHSGFVQYEIALPATPAASS